MSTPPKPAAKARPKVSVSIEPTNPKPKAFDLYVWFEPAARRSAGAHAYLPVARGSTSVRALM